MPSTFTWFGSLHSAQTIRAMACIGNDSGKMQDKDSKCENERESEWKVENECMKEKKKVSFALCIFQVKSLKPTTGAKTENLHSNAVSKRNTLWQARLFERYAWNKKTTTTKKNTDEQCLWSSSEATRQLMQAGCVGVINLHFANFARTENARGRVSWKLGHFTENFRWCLDYWWLALATLLLEYR